MKVNKFKGKLGLFHGTKLNKKRMYLTSPYLGNAYLEKTFYTDEHNFCDDYFMAKKGKLTNGTERFTKKKKSKSGEPSSY